MRKLISTLYFATLLFPVYGQTNVYPSDGNVGIGTIDPKARLHLHGDMKTPWSFKIAHYQETWIPNNAQERIWLIKDWSVVNGDYLYLASTGNDPTNQGHGAMIMSDYDKKISFGLASDATNDLELSATFMTIFGDGDVGIGTSDTKGYKLAVDGKAVMEEVNVKLSENWPDYVFAEDYDLTPLSEVENYIRENQHLPEIPSAEEIAQEGQNLGEMNALLLKKIEELTLYVIELERENRAIKNRLDKLDQ